MLKGRIKEAPFIAGTQWQLPFTLLVWCLNGWRPVGRYATKQLALAAAARRRIEVEK